MDSLISWILDLIPPFPGLLIYSGISLLAILSAGLISGALKRFACWRTGYTRKTLHFLIFGTAVGLHLLGGMPAVNILGVGMGLYVLIAVKAGEGSFFFEAMARESDAPRRSYFVIVPYLTTAAGGLLSNLLFSEAAVMGYALGGIADAVAEPVGVRFGKHRYRVASLKSVQSSQRSLEGSLAVFTAAAGLGFIFFTRLYGLAGGEALIPAILLAVTVTGVEALSPHGSDNLTIQVAASGLTSLFLHIRG